MKKTVDELRAKFPTGTLIEFEDGSWAFFKKPTRQVLGLAMTKARTNPIGLVDVIVSNCLVESSIDLKDEENIGYLMGLAERVDDIIGTKKAEVKN